jgi:hypothetical protein
VRKDISLFQEIWEQTNQEQREVSLFDIRIYLQCHEDKHGMDKHALRCASSSICFN